MAGAIVDGGPRYWAFISYSHKDAAFGRRLHRRLETYALPRRLIGRATPQGIVSARLAPIFRDREELPAAHDLSAEVQAALKASRSLIVVCSPDAAASRWVSREVELYRVVHPDRPILAAIRTGEPGECFPAALAHRTPDGTSIEPLAADFRRGRDGEQLGLLKLVAGVAGLGLDELVQRDAQRNRRRVTAITAASLAAVLGMGALTAFALNARYEAEHQRAEAEGLVEFMLTDLRDRLKGVGRIDVMTAVNERALHYYSDEDLNSLSVDSLERRARILHAMGEDDEAQGNHVAALAKFKEAERTTGQLLKEAPNDPVRLFDEAQSEYWVAYVDYQRGRNSEAKRGFYDYKDLVDRAVRLSPDNPKYLREAGYADGNLCSIMERPPVNAELAIKLCSSALKSMEGAAKFLPSHSGIIHDIANRHAWLADAYASRKDYDRARSERVAEQEILEHYMAKDPKNMGYKVDWVALQIALALLDEKESQRTVAKQRLERALTTVSDMVAFDPKNRSWKMQLDWIRMYLKSLTSNGGRNDSSPQNSH